MNAATQNRETIVRVRRPGANINLNSKKGTEMKTEKTNSRRPSVVVEDDHDNYEVLVGRIEKLEAQIKTLLKGTKTPKTNGTVEPDTDDEPKTQRDKFFTAVVDKDGNIVEGSEGRKSVSLTRLQKKDLPSRKVGQIVTIFVDGPKPKAIMTYDKSSKEFTFTNRAAERKYSAS